MGNPRRVSRIPPNAIQGDRRTRNKLPRTASRTDRRGGRVGGRTDPRRFLGKRHFGRGKKLQYLVRWKDYSPTHDQWVDKSDITADELVEIYERENREERPPRRSIRTLRKKANKVIRSLHLSPTSHDYYQPMSNNADTVNKQQVSADNSNPTTKVQSPQAAFPPITPVKDSPTVIDTAVFSRDEQRRSRPG